MAENGGPTAEHPDDIPDEPQRETRLQRWLGDRPISVFGVLLAGGAVLVLLLIVVVATSLNPNQPQRSTCLGIDFDEAEDAIAGGQVRQISIVTRQGDPETGPLAVTMAFNEDICRRLPEGIAAQPDLYRIIGMTTVYNQTFPGEQSIAINWEDQPDIPAELLVPPTRTPTPLATVTPTPTAEPTATPTITPTPAPTATATPTTAASPTAFPTRTPVPIPTATPRPTRAPASPTPLAPTPASPPAASPLPAATPEVATPAGNLDTGRRLAS